MDKMLKNLMLKDFIDELSSSSPAPGGGSAAALSASLASALTSMVFNLTIGKKSYNEYDESKKNAIISGLKNMDDMKFEFLEDMDKDAQAFLSVMSAFKLSKNTEDEKKMRDEKIESGYKDALEVPFELAKKSYKMYDFVEIAANYGNKNAISDAGVAALELQTAIEAAVLNVRINLSGIKNEKYKKEIDMECGELIKNGMKKKDEILKTVYSKI